MDKFEFDEIELMLLVLELEFSCWLSCLEGERSTLLVGKSESMPEEDESEEFVEPVELGEADWRGGIADCGVKFKQCNINSIVSSTVVCVDSDKHLYLVSATTSEQ